MQLRATPVMFLIVATLALSACASPGAAETDSTVPPSPTSAPTPPPTATPTASASAVDPGDVSTWTITAAGIGPVERGADSAQILDSLTAFEANEMCPGIVGLQRETGAEIVMSLADDGHISKVWVTAWGSDGSDSPATEAGIGLGSSMDALAAAYPDLSTVVQRGADTWVYSVQPDPEGMIDFVVEDDVVVLIGASDSSMTPKEWCG